MSRAATSEDIAGVWCAEEQLQKVLQHLAPGLREQWDAALSWSRGTPQPDPSTPVHGATTARALLRHLVVGGVITDGRQRWLSLSSIMFIIIPQWGLIGGVRMSRKTFIFGGYISDSLFCCCHTNFQQFVDCDPHQNTAHYQPILVTEPLSSQAMWNS